MIILNSHYYHIHLPQIISMKKEKPVSPVKAAKKTIKDRLVKELETIKTQLEKQGISIEFGIWIGNGCEAKLFGILKKALITGFGNMIGAEISIKAIR